MKIKIHRDTYQIGACATKYEHGGQKFFIVTAIFISLYSRANSPKAHSSGQSGQRRPELVIPQNSRPARAKALLRYLLAECDFSKLSNKICMIDVKIHIFASRKPTKRKETKKQKVNNIRISTFYQTYKSVFAYLIILWNLNNFIKFTKKLSMKRSRVASWVFLIW